MPSKLSLPFKRIPNLSSILLPVSSSRSSLFSKMSRRGASGFGPFGGDFFSDPFFQSPMESMFNDPFFGAPTGRGHPNQQRLTQGQGQANQGHGQGQLQASEQGQGQMQRRSPWDMMMMDPWRGTGMNQIRVDIHEDKDAYSIDAEVPGLDKKDIKLDIADGMLTISGEKKQDKREEDKDSKVVRIERSYGHVSRSIPLPRHVDEAKIEAKHEDGILKIKLPKSEQAKQSQIQIQ